MSADRNPRPTSANNPTNHVRLIRVPDEGSLTVRLLGPARGILVHWVRKKFEACPGEKSCPATIHRGKTVWRGYAPCEAWQESPNRLWVPYVLEITEKLWEQMDGQKLRGQMWELWRERAEERYWQVTGRVLDLLDVRKLRSDVQVEPVVCAVYGTVYVGWDVKPIRPRRQVLEPSTDAPPPTAAPIADPKGVVGTPEWEADQQEVRNRIKAALAKPSPNGHAKK